MKASTTTVAALVLSAILGTVTVAAPALGQGSVSDGGVTLDYPGFAAGKPPVTEVEVPTGTPHTTVSWWWYRLAGDDREHRFPAPDAQQYAGAVAVFDWSDVDGRGFSARLVATVRDASGGAGTAATVIQELRVTLDAGPGSLEVFHYADPDLNGDFDDAGALLADPDHIAVSDVGGPLVAAELLGLGAEAFEAAAWPSLIDALDDDDADDLDGSGLPFTPPGDFTAAFSWSSSALAAGEPYTVRSVLAAGVAAAAPEADLAIAKSDGADAAVPGEAVTYTVTVDNDGPATAFDARISDELPAALLGAGWTCASTAGAECAAAGAGDLDEAVLLPRGGRLVYTVTGVVDPAATGTLINTAAVAPPAGVGDPDPGDNAAADVDVLTPVADLAITKDDGVTSVVPGESTVTYVITATNAGPSSVAGALVADVFPPELGAVTWTCSGTLGGACAAAGSGDIADSVDLPAGAAVTYLATGDVAAGVPGLLINTATVTAPAGVEDPVAANDSATDVDVIEPTADLEIALTDGADEAVPGLDVSYTITAANHGPAGATGARVTDVFPPALGDVNWSCSPSPGSSCPASGSGDLDATVDLPAGGTVTFVATGTVDPGATGSLVNAATVAAPAGTLETDPGDNSAVDTDLLTPRADLGITVEADRDAAYPGTPVSYEIAVTNPGPSDADGSRVRDLFPDELLAVVWACEPTAGASCTADGSGDIDETVLLGAGASLLYLVEATIDPTALGPVANTATVTAAPSLVEIDPGDNTATATVSLWLFADGFEAGDASGWSAAVP